MKTAAIYARYSCENQTEQSIEGQLRVCQEYAASLGILIVETYIDRAMSGTNDNRAAFQQMLKDSDKKQFLQKNGTNLTTKKKGRRKLCQTRIIMQNSSALN